MTIKTPNSPVGSFAIAKPSIRGSPRLNIDPSNEKKKKNPDTFSLPETSYCKTSAEQFPISLLKKTLNQSKAKTMAHFRSV